MNGLSLILNTIPSIRWKWKSPEHQVVIGTDKFVYKIYEYDETAKFQSIIRYKLAEIYKEIGILWEISTRYNEDLDKYYDIEKREFLKVSDLDVDFTLHQSKNLYRELGKRLELDNILSQLNLPNIESLRVIRNSEPKSEDYAILNDKIILLDDADFSLILLDKERNITPLKNDIYNIHASYGDFIFRPLNYSSMKLDEINKPQFEWTLYFDTKKDTTNRTLLLDKYNLMLNSVSRQLYGDELMLTKEEEYLLYHNNVGRKSFQWELWASCNNLCTFCYLGLENRGTQVDRQLKSLEDFSDGIDNLDFDIYNNISIIGGDFFQGQLSNKEVHDKFFEVIRKIFSLYVDKFIGSIWITCTLTIGDQKDLYELLDLAKEMKVFPVEEYGASGLWLCTSWDAKGRFHTPDRKENWEYHMKKIKKDYPFVKLNTTMILTGDLCKEYVEGLLNFSDFEKNFQTSLFFKQCGVPEVAFPENTDNKEELLNWWLKIKQDLNKKFNLDFFPKRDIFVKFLQKCINTEPQYYHRLFNIGYRADELHRNKNEDYHDVKLLRRKDSVLEEESVPTGNCPKGHIIYYFCYSDDPQGCCLCDKEAIDEVNSEILN